MALFIKFSGIGLVDPVAEDQHKDWLAVDAFEWNAPAPQSRSTLSIAAVHGPARLLGQIVPTGTVIPEMILDAPYLGPASQLGCGAGASTSAKEWGAASSARAFKEWGAARCPDTAVLRFQWRLQGVQVLGVTRTPTSDILTLGYGSRSGNLVGRPDGAGGGNVGTGIWQRPDGAGGGN